MNYLLRTIQALLLMLMFSLNVLPLIAQEQSKGLIFSEIYLDVNKRENSWIEIYNPTDSKLTVTSFSHSAVKTVNLLRNKKNEDRFAIDPGKCLILCVDEDVFYAKWDKSIKVVEVKGMSGFGTGGYMSFSFKNSNSNGIDVFRFGKPARSEAVAEIAGNTVLDFVDDNKSWNRITNSKNYLKAEPTPGKNN